MKKFSRRKCAAAAFGLVLAGTLTFGVKFDAQAAGRTLIAGEWINMEGGPGVAQWRNEDGTIVEQPGVMPGDAQNTENTSGQQAPQGPAADPSQTTTQETTESAQTDGGRQIDPNKPMVALTFDDGPYAPVGNRIMDCLAQYGGKATFFMVGERVGSYKTEVQRMVAEGHEVANHTMNHKYLQKLGAAQIQAQVNNGNDAIQAACGVRPTLLRLPGGNHNATVLANAGMPMIQWNVDTLDWKTRNADKTVAAVLNHVKDGDIILMHELYGATGDAVARIVPELHKRGFQMVTVSQMAAAKGRSLEAGKLYSSFH